MFDYFIIFYFTGSLLAIIGYIYIFVIIDEISEETPWYSLWKMIIDFIGVIVLSWFAIPFLIVVAFSLRDKNFPIWKNGFISYLFSDIM